MCGLAGIFDTRAERPIDVEVLGRMTDIQTHRGPDERGIFVTDGVGLGHRRLSIIDVENGQQPMLTDDRTVAVVFNGQIYNYRSVRDELERAGHRFKTNSDTEIIGYAWKEWREACVERFRGMFAFALWDKQRKQLFLARDRIGIKPLYYTLLSSGLLLFSSELKGIMAHPDFDRTVDPKAVEDYFAYGYIPDPKSVFRNTYKLPPGHWLSAAYGQPVPEPTAYWDVTVGDPEPVDEHEAAEKLVSLLSEAIDMRLMSEVPIGAFLSGGVDSSAVVALMAGLTPERVKTCSIGFDEASHDESEYANQMARLYQTDHSVEKVRSDAVGLVDKLAAIYDEPFADSSAMPTYRLCGVAREKVTVALSGDGGDECLGGYRRYLMHLNEERVRRRLPLWLRQCAFGALGKIYPKADWAPRIFRAKYTLQALGMDSVSAYFHSVSVFSDGMRKQLFSDDFRTSLSGYGASQVLRELADKKGIDDPLAEIQYLDIKTYLPGDILTKVDRASMAHSLEVRVPMLDHCVVDYAIGLPRNLKMKGSSGKHILKVALEDRVPEDILYRPKMGFSVPLAQWFRGSLRDVVSETLLGGQMQESGVFNNWYLSKLVRQHQSGVRDNSTLIWPLLVFGATMQNFSRVN